MPPPLVPSPPANEGHVAPMEKRAPVVGVFDSGVGGLSVLQGLKTEVPQARLVYVADSGQAPYGERDEAWLQARCLAIAEFLRGRGADLMIIACNTATAAAAPQLRARHPSWPIVGMEPAVKPAARQSSTGRVGVMATRNTLLSQRYARLLADHGQGVQVTSQPCTGLAMAIERGDEPSISRLVAEHTLPLRQAQVDTLVLGCTHYPFARRWIEQAMGPSVTLVDTTQAVARRAASLLSSATNQQGEPRRADAPASAQPAADEFWTSGEPPALESFAQRWLGWNIKAQPLVLGAAARDATTTDR